MREQLPHYAEFDASGLPGDISVQPQPLPKLDMYDVSPLTDISLLGDGVALPGLEVTSTLTHSASEKGAYMFATEKGDTCPVGDCVVDTDVGDKCWEGYTKGDNC